MFVSASGLRNVLIYRDFIVRGHLFSIKAPVSRGCETLTYIDHIVIFHTTSIYYNNTMHVDDLSSRVTRSGTGDIGLLLYEHYQ